MNGREPTDDMFAGCSSITITIPLDPFPFRFLSIDGSGSRVICARRRYGTTRLGSTRFLFARQAIQRLVRAGSVISASLCRIA